MKKTLFLMAVLLLIVVFFGGCTNNSSQNFSAKQKQSVTEEKNKENTTALYLVKIDRIKDEKRELENKQDGREMPISEFVESSLENLPTIDICNGKVAEVRVDGKLSPKEALEKLLAYKNNSQQEFYNAFNKSKDVRIDKLMIKNNFATVVLSGDIQADEFCYGQLMHDQIYKTLTQFDNIDGADVFVGDKEISEYIATKENKK
jgi:PBP1b-binding outer membrane lipoprotein LpoB